MLAFLGDIHCSINALYIAYERMFNHDGEKPSAIIQVGDFGLYPQTEHLFQEFFDALNLPVPVYFIDGNHDDCSHWITYETVTNVMRNLYYVPRGTVMELDGKTIAFMGGAKSIDMKQRIKNGYAWDPNENIRTSDVKKLRTNIREKTIDYFITHVPPASVTDMHFNPFQKLRFGVPVTWEDENQYIIEELWNDMGNPYIISGHMHKRVIGENYRILAIDEIITEKELHR